MPVLIRAAIDRCTGEVQLRFPFEQATIETVKTVPGSHYDPQFKRWITSIHGLPILEQRGLKIETTIVRENRALIPEVISKRLWPHQLEGAYQLITNGGWLLTMDMRTGKTPTAMAAMTALFSAGQIDACIVAYPNGVKHEWERQLKEWANIDLVSLEGLNRYTVAEIEELRTRPYLVIGCHYEILDRREKDLHAILNRRRFAVIADEIHSCKNRKAGRTKALKNLAVAKGKANLGTEEEPEWIESGFNVARWGLTGTPMRNRPRDLFCLFDFIIPGSMGGYWTFAKKYCGSHVDDQGHWTDHEETNSEELALRLAKVSYRKTRQEVASFLPKSDRKVIVCKLRAKDMRKYRSLERIFATKIKNAINDSDPISYDRKALEQLAAATTIAKIPIAAQRVYEHAGRNVKVLVFATFHDTLSQLGDWLDQSRTADQNLPIHFMAGGWMTPEKRRAEIDLWKACPGPAILLANTLSSNVGIDLSDAEVAIFLELAWVPADFAQAEARIQDVHLGKRTTPPIYEYLIVKDTIDEAMAATLLEKVRSIENVVGKDVETSGVAATLRASGVVGPARLGLPNTDKDTIQAAILSIRARMLDTTVVKDNNAAMAVDAAEAFDETDPNAPTDEIPF